MAKRKKINSSTSYTDFDSYTLTKMQNEFSQQRYLTVSETGIWLKLSQNCVRKMIKEGKIVAIPCFGTNAIRVDVEKTKALFDKNIRTTRAESEVEITK